ncbi:MAG: HAD family phosphatase [Synechococcales cyanobacterium T60_A2020_003]|nr:HAD family phosphatase [Synechococcales cyanobacterium T60_A2020_003]
MTLKAVLFDFNGVIINDERIHEQLLNDILLGENLRLRPGEYQQVCLGRSDRACLKDLLMRQGRVVSDDYLSQLVLKKTQAYQAQLAQLDVLPTFPGLTDFIYQLRVAHISLAIVSGAVRAEIELVLQRAKLADYFSVIVAGDEISSSKPDPDGYLLAVERLNQLNPTLKLKPSECLALEDTFAGIQAAKKAGISVVGVANTYPFHMMQRRANWAVDYLNELELERIQRWFAGEERSVAA